MKTTNLKHMWHWAGFSRPTRDMRLRFRVSKSADRQIYLIKLGELDVEMIELPRPMNVKQVAEYLLTAGIANTQEKIACVKTKLETLK